MKNAIFLTHVLTPVFTLIFLSLMIGFSHQVFGADYFSPRTAAIGGSGSAGSTGTDAIYLNPSATAFQKSYAGTASFNKYSGHDNSEPKGRVFHASILDGTNEFLQAGVGYTRRADATLLHLGAAKSMTDWLGFGVGVKRFYNHLGLENSMQYSASTFFNFTDSLKISVMADNLREDEKSKAWGLYRQYTAGLKLNLQNILMIYYDPTYSNTRPGRKSGYSAGAELMVMDGLYFRYGMNKAVNQAHLGTVGDGIGYGVGFVFPRISFDLAIYRTMAPIYTTGKIGSATIAF